MAASVASRGLLRRALSRPVGPSSSARSVATDTGVVPAAGRKYSRPQVQPPLNAKKARGLDILNDPLWNKGTAFSVAERDRLGLKGLLPPVVKTIEEQRVRHRGLEPSTGRPQSGVLLTRAGLALARTVSCVRCASSVTLSTRTSCCAACTTGTRRCSTACSWTA